MKLDKLAVLASEPWCFYCIQLNENKSGAYTYIILELIQHADPRIN